MCRSPEPTLSRDHSPLTALPGPDSFDSREAAATEAAPSEAGATEPGYDLAQIVKAYECAVVRLLLAAVEGLARDPKAGVSSRRVTNFLRGNGQPPGGPGHVAVLKLFGAFASSSSGWVEKIMERLIESGELQEVESARWTRVRLSNWGRRLMESSDSFSADVLPRTPRLGTHPELEGKLWEVRRRLAEKEARAPYGVFPNRTLVALAVRRPRSLGDLAQIPGFGEARIRKYGRAVLEVVRGEASDVDAPAAPSGG